MKILIVEDELIPANYLKRILEKESHEVLPIVQRGANAITEAKLQKPELIFMDIMLKDNISGADAAVAIHQNQPEIVIIFLTAFSDKEMIEFAIRSEAFAYLLKPYRDKEILATLQLAKAKIDTNKTTITTEETETNPETIKLVGGYLYHKKLKRVFLEEKEIELGPKALQLIQLLCQNPKITIEIDDIMEQLWDEPKPKQTLRSLIHRIRQMTHPELIQNANKLGYKIGLLT